MNAPLRHHPVVEAFRDFARRYSAAQRRLDRVRVQFGSDSINDAISAQQEIEQEVAECFVLVRSPAQRRPM